MASFVAPLPRLGRPTSCSVPPPCALPDQSTETKKLAIITGANSGIGFETAKALGGKGLHVVLACRDATKASAAAGQLREAVPGGSFETRPLALDSLASVRDFVKETLDAGREIDVLVNNAGVMACPQMQTQDGFEYQLGVNHLGHHALTLGLLPLLTTSQRESRIVTVSSTAHLFGELSFDDINMRRNYDAWSAYGRSKFANILFAFELAKRLPTTANCTSNALHPGVVATELFRFIRPNLGPFDNPLVLNLMSKFLKTSEQGAENSIYVATSPDLERVTSKYFVDCKPTTARSSAYDPAVRRQLWDLSCEMTGVGIDVNSIAERPSPVLV